jgi:hypothetical protein
VKRNTLDIAIEFGKQIGKPHNEWNNAEIEAFGAYLAAERTKDGTYAYTQNGGKSVCDSNAQTAAHP